MIEDQTKQTSDSPATGGETLARPSIRRFLLLSAFLGIAALVAVRWGPYPEVNARHDIKIYILRGSWWPKGLVPYSEVFSEYPEVATWFLAFPHGVIAVLEKTTGIALDHDDAYRYIFTFAMAVFLAGTITLLYAMRTDRRWYAYLMLLPSIWYFSHNRYDIVPAFLVVLSLFLLQRSRHYWAFGILGVATMTKWYPLVILPVFVSYLWRRNRQVTIQATLVFGLVVVAIVIPTLVTAGLNGFLVPYEFHAARAGNSQSFLTILDGFSILDREDGLARHVFQVLQFLPAVVVLFVRIRSWRILIAWSALTVMSFILFNSVYSPQWIVWVAPLFILLATGALDVVLLVAYNLTNSIMAPYGYALRNKDPETFRVTIIANLIMLTIWLLRVGWIALMQMTPVSQETPEETRDQKQESLE